MKTGLFAGTFDPFTIGHASVVRRALQLFDRVVVAVGVNDAKHPETTAQQRVEAIRSLYADDERVTVVAYSGLTVDVAREHGAAFIVKGVRSVRDYESEREQAEVNRRLAGIDTVLLMAEPGLEAVSSSTVRSLRSFGRDVSEFLPK
ncbi:MAG: pantetheine-phosphate adenylyltransferase [Prevotella sp.]|nr:pantetheine-phosphate adenylyltransferase [Muribaculaceae bacterium]MBQ6193746.1 pantetheine-phosphate adenylyltransferase [Prevotella sp.]MBR0268620.1 pantetheine-phosphate adenylyltransferase [Prevotella sp.]MBR0526412.1 pantetheine-phosphate adenylyltransferase [Prevotella sp.]MBR3010596.1 pantetheine-phosphate adenylyltransferase [Prevotella sp.]